MTGRRILAVVLVNAAGILAAAELAAYGVARLRLGDTYASARQARDEALLRIPRRHRATVRDLGSPQERAPDNLPRQVHPYFGLTLAPGLAVLKTNDQGFVGEEHFPRRRTPREAVIGVFGGSVALDLRLPRPSTTLAQGLLPALAARGYDHASVVMFAQGAWKEPQHLLAFVTYAPDIDVAIFLDGFNEISGLPPGPPGEAVTIVRPPDFPVPNVHRPLSRRNPDLAEADGIRRVMRIRDRQLWLTRLVSREPLAHSMLAHVVWRIAMERWERETRAFLPHHFEPSTGARTLTRADLAAAHVARYASFTRTALDVGRGLGIPTFHFLQPNQYVEGAKPLGDTERRVATREETTRAVVRQYYPGLRRVSRDLSRDGYPSYDLTMIFQEHAEQLYRDSCCHLREDGMDLIAVEIVARILESGALAVLPRAETAGGSGETRVDGT